ncbi:MAG TPA: glycosyltransferase family 2 protein [Verrucomicrobiae bacterium]|jgi:glycosyltransferase involved in cell wall biosynthesis|nr:glycosyltransferase family 2 protein [Verrucomicrobiae bacterium]
MNWPAECAVVIPCLNESATIGNLVERVRAYLPTILVVDDGSIDDTARIASKAGATVVKHPESLGKGAALRTGWKWVRDQKFQWTLTMDGDGQHSPTDIPAFLKRAEQAKADLVIGNRMMNPRGMPWIRRTVNRWMSERISTLAGCKLPDSQSGFRLIRLNALPDLPPTIQHFEIESEVLLAFARARRRIEFVPIQVIYKTEQSKIHPLVDTVRWFKWLSRVKRGG